MERFKIKVIKKYNVSPEIIMPRYRSRPKHEMSGIIVGRNVDHTEVQDYLMQYFRESGMIDRILSVRYQV